MNLLDGINDTEDEVYSFDATMSMKKKLDNETIENAFDDIKLICDNARFDEEFSIYEEYQEQFDIVEDALNDLYERRDMMQRFNEACEPHIIEDEVYKKAELFDFLCYLILKDGDNAEVVIEKIKRILMKYPALLKEVL